VCVCVCMCVCVNAASSRAQSVLTPLSLSDVLDYPPFRKVLRAFMEEKLAAENIAFLDVRTLACVAVRAMRA